jgi:peroxiredoxin
MSIEIGAIAPGFVLPDTEGEQVSPLGGAASVVVFTCNHCPYALAWHQRLLDVARDYAGRGVRMLLICANDAERYPQDGPGAMRERVRREGPWPAPYLYDETQRVALAYGATVTPDVFLLDEDGRLRWHGAPDAGHGDESLRAGWLREALDQVLAGELFVDPPQRDVVGCSIKWRPAPPARA